MKPKFPHAPLRRPGTSPLLAAVVATVAICTALSACSSLLPGDTSPETSPPATTTPSSDINALRTYYEALLAELKQELLDAKQADYITRLEYESRIAELESRIESGEDGDRDPSDRLPVGSDIPVSGDPNPLPTVETDPPAQNAPSASFRYEIRSEGAVILAYLGSARAVTVPESIAGYPVTHIADDAFKASDVTSVILPGSVTHVGWFAFADCPGLTSVTLPASVTSIGYGAFDGSPNLTLFCPKDSYAAEYARSFALRVRYV